MKNIQNVAEQQVPEYVSLNHLKASFRDWKHYLLRKRAKIIGIWIFVLACFIAVSFLTPRKYIATLSFALQSEESGGGLSDLASQFGFSIGGGSMGAFGGDNLFELLQSRLMVEKALLLPEKIDGKQTNLLNYYIDSYDMRKGWQESEDPQMSTLAYPLDQPRESFSRVQDSIFLGITHQILKKQLVVEKRNKKLSIGDIEFISINEKLSKLFVENLMSVTGDYYIQTKTKRANENYQKLRQEADSVRLLYARAVQSRAVAADNTPNSVRQSSLAGVVERTTEMQYLAATYAELQKNVELARVSMNSNAPLIDVIDAPVYPLLVKKFGLFKAVFLGGFVGGFLSLLFYTLRFVCIYILGWGKSKESETTSSNES